MKGDRSTPVLGPAVKKHRRRKAQGDPSPSLLRHLSLIGSLGFMIVTPLLVGIYAGRWIDKVLNTGITFTSALLLAGLVGGCVMAWKRVQKP